MNECIGHVIGKPHSPVTGLYIGKMILPSSSGCHSDPPFHLFGLPLRSHSCRSASQYCYLVANSSKAYWLYNHDRQVNTCYGNLFYGFKVDFNIKLANECVVILKFRNMTVT